METCDLLVIGLGTAGAAAAALGARAGLKVIGLDARPLDEAGARWVNALPRWTFAAAGFAAPEPPELVAQDTPFHLIAGWEARARVVIRAHSLLEVDMRALVARLQRDAVAAGADLRGGVRARGRDGDVVHTDQGPITARVIADASGLAGAALGPRPAVPPTDLCAAAQEVRVLRDPQAAEQWFRARGSALGETLCFTGVAGGYSIVSVTVHQGEVSLLTGAIPALGQPAGKVLLERFAADQPWVGERIYGGSRAIPLAPPPSRLDHGPLALLGDAGNQVFAVHGSGIAAGMLAARCLVDALVAGGGPAEYNHRWQRTYGGLYAGANLFARFSRSISPDDLVRLMNSGLVGQGTTRDGLEQRQPTPDLGDIPGLITGVFRAPGPLWRLLPVLIRMQALRLHYLTYPRDPAALPAWEARLARLL